jgi:FMN phosphatase YigB (HAD superfamily)
VTVSDQRLAPIVTALAEDSFDVLSVDIFDTLLWRRVPEPKDIFVRLADALHEDQVLTPSVTPVQFAELRAAAERAARAAAEAKSGSREVLLLDIYAHLPDHLWRPDDGRARAVLKEVAVESAGMILDEDVAALMRTVRDGGKKVILTSDTYFARDHLVQFLHGAGFGPDDLPAFLFISNEHGRPKWRDLFDLILKDLGVPANRMVHVGDNIDADVAPCAARGIGYIHYDKWQALPRALNHELPKDVGLRTDWVARGGDGGLTGLRSRLGFRTPSDLSPDLQSFWAYGATVLAPLFTAYAHWVDKSVGEHDAMPVFGVMREGRFLARLVSQVSQSLKPGELWLSRRAVVRASLWPDDLSALPQAVTYCPGPTTDDVLAQLGLTRADLDGVFKDPTLFDLEAADGIPAFLQGVAASAALQKKLARHSAYLRANLFKYLDAHIDFEGIEKVALLDLGYAGTIQSSLQKILLKEGRGVTLTGFYVAVNGLGRDRILAGTDLRALLSAQGYSGRLVSLLERTPDILEHACMCPDGSLDGFDVNGAPVLLPSQRSAAQIAQMEAMQDGLLNGARACLTVLGLEVVESASFLEHASCIVEQAMLFPSQDEVQSIGGWLHEANFDLADQRALADLRADAAQLEFGGPGAWASIGRHEAYWPQAALSRISSDMGVIAAAINSGQADAALISSGNLFGDLVILPDLGVGADSRRAVSVPLTVSPLGRGEIRATLKPFGPDAYTSFTMVWPSAPSIVSLSLCALVFQGETQHNVVDLTDQVKCAGDMTQQRGYLEIGPNGATMVIDLSSVTVPWPHQLDLVLRFTYARLGRMM